MPTSNSEQQIRQRFADSYQKFSAKMDSITKRNGVLQTARGVLLLASVVAWIFVFTGNGIPAILAAIAVTLGFLAIAFIHNRAEIEFEILSVRAKYALESVLRIDRNWSKLSTIPYEIPDDLQATAKDLDFFGKASLFQFACLARTPLGIETLGGWLLKPTDRQTLLARQKAVAELANHEDFREQLFLHAERISGSRTRPDAFVEWAESEPWLASRPYVTWISRLLSVFFILTLSGLMFGAIDKAVGGITLIVVCVINFFWTIWFAGRVHDIFNAVAAKQADIQIYLDLFTHVQQAPSESDYLRDCQVRLKTEGGNAYDLIRQLGLIMAAANLRRAGMFGIIYLILQFTLLWDFHMLSWMESWHQKHRRHVRGWFEVIGILEAISSLAKIHSDNPEWTFPEPLPESESPYLKSKGMGHPLIRSDIRVCNDAELAGVGSVLLVTGSNMSGKSTLLRAIGTNVALAQAGSVVCCQSMTWGIARIETSMRIHDSLASQTSFYMAELKRLKLVVDSARNAKGVSLPILYLLDEILQGTNSRERHIAVSRVVAHLLECYAYGAISTHDLELIHAEGLEKKAVPVHFRESFVDENGVSKMVFDYQMRPGVSTTTNALKLLEMVGLSDTSKS